MNKDKHQLEVDKNYEWFIYNKKEIIENNPKKIGYFALIRNQKIIGFFKTYEEVILEANKSFKDELFSIQRLEKKDTIHNLGFLSLKWVR